MGIRLERPAGPLAMHRSGYRAELQRLGYTPGTIKHHLVVFNQLDRFMLGEQIGLDRLTEKLIERFIAVRLEENFAACRSPRMLVPLLAWLREQGVIAPAVPVAPGTPVEIVIDRWRRHLREQRAMTPRTIRGYVDVVRPLLAAHDDGTRLRVEELDTQVIRAFMSECAQRFAPKTMQRLASALRSFLAWAFMTGLAEAHLSAAVPPVACRSLGLPKFLTGEQVQALLAACDSTTSAGTRDRAIMLLLWRLGLRSGEVAALHLDDIDWRGGQLTIAGKGGKNALLPLPVDVGQAVADWLRVRPRTADRAVFVRSHAPYRSLTSGGMTMVVAAASKRAGLEVLYAHRLRHTAATAMLAAGASLPEIGQVLRHQNPVTTGIYARVNVEALRTLARPWSTEEGAR